MEPINYVVEQLKGFGKVSQDLIDSVIPCRQNSARRNPIEILKRLQREAFSDLMKLRDRQDKVERVLSFYKTSKGSPFQEASTSVRGEIDLSGALLMLNAVDQHNYDAVSRAGIKTGINSRLIFETTIREKDSLVAEFVTSQKDTGFLGDATECPLSLAKVFYRVNVTDWMSAVAIPLGAQCRDVAVMGNSSLQGKGHTAISSFGPPLLNQHNGGALLGLTVRKSNIIASLAQFVSGIEVQPHYDRIGRCLGIFGQLVCQLPSGTKLSLLGVHRVPKLSSQHVRFEPLTIPICFSKPSTPSPETVEEAFVPPRGTDTEYNVSNGSIALVLESQLDEDTRIGGWIEMSKSNPKYIQWAVSMSDDSEDSFGWGMGVGGLVGGPTDWDHFQAESYVKVNLGKRFNLKPGVAYVSDGNARLMALMLRSNWSL